MSDETPETTVRVLYTRPNASTLINGVRFGVLRAKTDQASAILVSEPITAEQADHACRGMARFDPAAYTKAELNAADAQIARERQAAAEVAQGAKGGAVASLERQLAEQQATNQRQSAAMQTLRQERDVAVQKLSDSSVPKLEEQVKQLAAEVIAKDKRITQLEAETADLRRMNAELAPPPETTGKQQKRAAA